MNKYCPHCHYSMDVIKFGKTNTGKQRYKCKHCQCTWSNDMRPNRKYDCIWHDFAINDYTVKQLANKYGLSDKTLRNILNTYKVAPIIPQGQHEVIATDVTYLGEGWGLLIVIDANTGEGLYVAPTHGYETSYDYRKAIKHLAGFGVRPKVCVVDGKKSVISMLEEYNIIPQCCQFHQIKTINSYLPRKPILQPDIDLKKLSHSLTHVKSETFAKELNGWLNQYYSWLNEQNINPATGKLEYSHQKTRTAVKNLRSNLWYLFNCEFYSNKFQIPNTNNRLEGINRALKYKLRHHSGASKELKIKIAVSFISSRTGV